MMCRARRRRVLSQFEDLQQCYLRLRKAGKSAAPKMVQPTKQAASKHAADDSVAQPQQSLKRAKKDQAVSLQPPEDAGAVLDPFSNGSGPSAALVPPRASVSPKVCMLSHLYCVHQWITSWQHGEMHPTAWDSIHCRQLDARWSACGTRLA